MNRMEKYHADYVSQRKAPPLVAVTPAAMEIEQRAIAREKKRPVPPGRSPLA